MNPPLPLVVTVAFAALCLGPSPAAADETDNFTCRQRPLAESMPVLDALLNAEIQAAIARANAARDGPCGTACLIRELQSALAANERQLLTGIPHARLARTIQRHPRVDRCHLEFRESIYGARRYDHPWLLPFLGRVIWLADSIRLSGRIVGIDKINHFIREGLSHWRAAGRPGGDIADVLARELGSPARRWSMTERGLKGLALTGVLSYADLAASYAGYRYWRDLLSLDGPGAYVGRDARSGQYVQRRRVTFADYVTDAWDEAINCSAFLPAAARDVRIALGRRGLQCPVTDCRTLAALPSAALYVNPACRSAAAADTYRTTRAAPIVQ